MDEQLRPYYDTSLNGKDKGIIASLIAAQFFPEYILPKWLQPAKQFKQYLAGAGAVTGALLTGNPIGALMGAMLGYLSPSLGALGYYSRKKSRKVAAISARLSAACVRRYFTFYHDRIY